MGRAHISFPEKEAKSRAMSVKFLKGKIKQQEAEMKELTKQLDLYKKQYDDIKSELDKLVNEESVSALIKLAAQNLRFEEKRENEKKHLNKKEKVTIRKEKNKEQDLKDCKERFKKIREELNGR